MDQLVVTRSLELPASVDDAWRSLATVDGLRSWLADELDLAAVVPGASGTATEDGTARRLVVTEVDEGRSVRFTWWDEAAPELTSTVELVVEAEGEGSRITVTERLLGAAVATVAEAGVADLAAASAQAWERRLGARCGLAATVLEPAFA